MAFIQIIDMHTKKVDEITALEKEWRAATEGKRTLRRSIVARDRNDADHYLVLAFFDSHESAMVNSNLPETGEFGQKQAAFLDGPMEFLDLDVIEDQPEPVRRARRRATSVTDVAPPAELFSLQDRVVVLTGASSGLGARWAPVLGAAGARLVLTARRERELAAVADGVPGSLAVPGDVTDADHRPRLVEATVATFGRIDVLVNNAGGALSAPAADTSLDDFAAMIDTDLTALFALTQLVGRHMVRAGRGSIINNASLAAERSVDRYPLAAYSAAKAGVVALTRSLAAEWGRSGVRVNAVGPAFFPTPTSGFLQDPEQVAWIEAHNALGRTARIDELDGTIVFLASDTSSFVTGQHLLVDGGWSVY